MITRLKNIRANKSKLSKIICFAALMLSSVLRADINEELWSAILVGNVAQVEQLINKGANVNRKAQDNGWTALMVAAKSDNFEVCKLLIEKGADVNARSKYDSTALMLTSDYEICKLLIDHGANVNAIDDVGTTVLLASTHKSGSLEKCKLLIEKGANVYAIDQWGNTPLKLAVNRTRVGDLGPIKANELCRLLIDAMLKAPLNQTLLKPIHLTPEQRGQINALVANLKNTLLLRELHRDTKRLIVEGVINSFKRRNFIEAQIMAADDKKLKQELLDYLNSRIELQIKENPQMMQKK